MNEDYTNNLKDIKLKGSVVLKNNFSFDNPIANAMKGIGSSGGSNSRYPQEDGRWQFPSFYQEKFFYYELSVKGKKTIIKGDIMDNIETIYQYNKKQKDTLYFILQNTLYKAYITR